jgi:cobyric acid synthase
MVLGTTSSAGKSLLVTELLTSRWSYAIMRVVIKLLN